MGPLILRCAPICPKSFMTWAMGISSKCWPQVWYYELIRKRPPEAVPVHAQEMRLSSSNLRSLGRRHYDVLTSMSVVGKFHSTIDSSISWPNIFVLDMIQKVRHCASLLVTMVLIYFHNTLIWTYHPAPCHICIICGGLIPHTRIVNIWAHADCAKPGAGELYKWKFSFSEIHTNHHPLYIYPAQSNRFRPLFLGESSLFIFYLCSVFHKEAQYLFCRPWRRICNYWFPGFGLAMNPAVRAGLIRARMLWRANMACIMEELEGPQPDNPAPADGKNRV